MTETVSSEIKVSDRIAGLGCFEGAVRTRPLVGGLCNTNFDVSDNKGRYVVRIGGDIAVHGIVQHSVENAMRAAAALGVSPGLIHAEEDIVVSRFIEGRALVASDVNDEAILEQWVARLRVLHSGGGQVAGALTYFSAFQTARRYLRYCRDHRDEGSDEFEGIDGVIDGLEADTGPFLPAFTHNDVVPQNAMVDTDGRVFLIDWDYGGFGDPWFDVAGLATNADANPAREDHIIALYSGDVSTAHRKRFALFKVAVNLREYLWGRVQDLASGLDAGLVSESMAANYPGEASGYGGYASLNRRRFETSLQEYRNRHA